jgi:hypothetical protein
MPLLFTKTTTAQSIMNQTAQDVRQTLDPTTAPGSTTLLDYCNRVSLDILRTSRWLFVISPVKQFATQLGVSNYWIGTTGSAPAGAYDTGLNLTDLRTIKQNSVFDRSNFRQLAHIDEVPLSTQAAYADSSSRLGRPTLWRQDEATPGILNIYPCPDNQTTFRPQPEPPICTTAVSGALANRFYFVSVTFVDTLGNETTAPVPTKIFVPANSVLKVAAPTLPLSVGTTGVKYDRYNVYAASAPSGTNLGVSDLKLQATGVNLSTAGDFTEPGTGLTAGVAPPTTNAVEPIDGYVIEFRYFQAYAQLANASQILQIPDDYSPIVTAGVNALAFQYLTRPQEASMWQQMYEIGLRKIVRDMNRMQGKGFISPDPSAVRGTNRGLDF